MTPVREFAKNNKFVSIFIGLIASGLLGWGIWVTRGVFAGDVHVEKINNICSDVSEVKEEVNSLKTKVGSLGLQLDVQAMKMDTQILKTESNQQEILRTQEAILRELRRKGKIE